VSGKSGRLNCRAYRRRDRVHVPRAAPPLQRESAEREHAEQGAEEREAYAHRRRAWLEPGRYEGDDETDARRGEPHGEEDAREPRHAKASVEHGVPVALLKAPDERRPEQRAVPRRVPIVE